MNPTVKIKVSIDQCLAMQTVIGEELKALTSILDDVDTPDRFSADYVEVMKREQSVLKDIMAILVEQVPF